jgi:hypothetical protein
MLHPLVSLWRHSCRVTFYDQGIGGRGVDADDLSGSVLPPLGVRRDFNSAEEAVSYLRFWAAEPAASAELRWLLKKCSPSGSAGGPGERWLNSLASLLMQGTVAIVEETARRATPARIGVASTGSATPAATAAALAAMPALASVPAIVPPPNLLPLVEDVRIEGAEVLPELNQSLDQVTATIGKIEAASADVQPAPNKVPDITEAMKAAADRAQQSLDGA